ncbi:hypothetical protein [Bordetella sp. LUAb4]|uniref:hypothetical protein n=1 Tax=Bordetella sp. LUAb4 TaxID=2843195 RepID=UPI001E63BF64|nr:hypothetical protein [Bordetella sp. LUAb4]
MASTVASDADVQILIMVDEKSLSPGTNDGIYVMDNTSGSQSVTTLTAGLAWQTVAGQGDIIAWNIVPLNPQSFKEFKITNISNSKAWGFGGTPTNAIDEENAMVGRADESGKYTYSISISVSDGDSTLDDLDTFTIPASIDIR